jgi:hypothetical protein
MSLASLERLTFYSVSVSLVKKQVIEKNQPENNVLVLRRIHVIPQRISRSPELSFKTLVIVCVGSSVFCHVINVEILSFRSRVPADSEL